MDNYGKQGIERGLMYRALINEVTRITDERLSRCCRREELDKARAEIAVLLDMMPALDDPYCREGKTDE